MMMLLSVWKVNISGVFILKLLSMIIMSDKYTRRITKKEIKIFSLEVMFIIFPWNHWPKRVIVTLNFTLYYLERDKEL